MAQMQRTALGGFLSDYDRNAAPVVNILVAGRLLQPGSQPPRQAPTSRTFAKNPGVPASRIAVSPPIEGHLRRHVSAGSGDLQRDQGRRPTLAGAGRKDIARDQSEQALRGFRLFLSEQPRAPSENRPTCSVRASSPRSMRAPQRHRHRAYRRAGLGR